MKFSAALISTALLFVISGKASAQNYGFEDGLTGWQKTGAITIDKSDAHKGNACAQVGEGTGSVFKHVPVAPFAVVQFEAYIKSSTKGVKGYSFIRFYNAKRQKLLEYKSKALDSTNYQQTGNYTEAPPFAAYMEIGIEKDPSVEGYIYADDFSIDARVGEPKVKHQSQVNTAQYMRPFWKADTIYNETVLLFSKDEKAAEGRLLYTPDKILSVRKFDMQVTYKADADYTLNGNVITRTQNSDMPFRADTSFDTKKDLAWYNTQSQWVVVTYTHHDQWTGPVPQFKGDNVPLVMDKLKAKKPVKIVAYGMSITRGLDVSSYDTVPPYMPTYVSLFADRLQRAYKNNNIKLYNAGLPGADAEWGARYAEKYINPLKPDLVIIDFGMNDFWRYTPDQFKGFIQTVIKKIRTGNPKVEIILLSNMKFDPDYILDSDTNKSFYVANMDGYSPVLKALEAEGIINLDMGAISDVIYQKKKAKDCLVNPLHPNDYMARWYAQGLSQLLIKNLK